MSSQFSITSEKSSSCAAACVGNFWRRHNERIHTQVIHALITLRRRRRYDYCIRWLVERMSERLEMNVPTAGFFPFLRPFSTFPSRRNMKSVYRIPKGGCVPVSDDNSTLISIPQIRQSYRDRDLSRTFAPGPRLSTLDVGSAVIRNTCRHTSAYISRNRAMECTRIATRV